MVDVKLKNYSPTSASPRKTKKLLKNFEPSQKNLCEFKNLINWII